MAKRGRPKGTKKPLDRLDENLVIPITPALKNTIGDLAEQYGMGTATFARYLLEKVINDQFLSTAGAADPNEPKT